VKELAPRSEKASLTDALIPSMAVRIPTRAIMPIAIIIEVSDARKRLPAIDCRAIDIFSRSEVFTAIEVISVL
jgi:hypothetical protein